MPEESRTRRLAILIDADNTSPRIAAGFRSVRRFNDAFRATYGRPPSSFRGAMAMPVPDRIQVGGR